MNRDIVPDRLQRQTRYECDICGDETGGASACYLFAGPMQMPGYDVIIEGDTQFNIEILCSVCLAGLNGYIEYWSDSPSTTDLELLTDKEANGFLDLLENSEDIMLKIRQGLDVVRYSGDFVVNELKLPNGFRVEPVERDELVDEITNQVDIKIGRVSQQELSNIRKQLRS
jgi:hypothetical protein